MTQIDFHTRVSDKIAYACRLVRKARAAQCKLVLLTSDAEQQAALDNALWTFSETDFLPHVAVQDPLANMTPIIITHDDKLDVPHHHILVNLSDAVPVYFARFERMFEVIQADAPDIEAGRKRYAYYKQRGYPLKHEVVESA